MLRYYLSNVPFVVVIFSWAASPSKHPHACYSKLKEENKYSFPYTISANLYLNWKLTTLLVDVFHYALCRIIFSVQSPEQISPMGTLKVYLILCLNISLPKHWCDLSSSVSEVVQQGDDCTALLAATASLSALLLLLLLCICTVLWYRQRRQAGRHFSFTYLDKHTHIHTHTFPVQKVWLKYNEEDRRLHAVSLHCPVVAFTKDTQYFSDKGRTLVVSRKLFFSGNTSYTKVREVRV